MHTARRRLTRWRITRLPHGASLCRRHILPTSGRPETPDGAKRSLGLRDHRLGRVSERYLWCGLPHRLPAEAVAPCVRRPLLHACGSPRTALLRAVRRHGEEGDASARYRIGHTRPAARQEGPDNENKDQKKENLRFIPQTSSHHAPFCHFRAFIYKLYIVRDTEKKHVFFECTTNRNVAF